MIKKPDECENMADVRAGIDALDDQLIDLLCDRFGYIDRAWQFKSNPEEATVPWRIQEVIDRVRERSERQGFPPELAEALWRQLIGWAIQHEEQKLRERQA